MIKWPTAPIATPVLPEEIIVISNCHLSPAKIVQPVFGAFFMHKRSGWLIINSVPRIQSALGYGPILHQAIAQQVFIELDLLEDFPPKCHQSAAQAIYEPSLHQVMGKGRHSGKAETSAAVIVQTKDEAEQAEDRA